MTLTKPQKTRGQEVPGIVTILLSERTARAYTLIMTREFQWPTHAYDVYLVRMGGAGWGGVSCSLFLMLRILLVYSDIEGFLEPVSIITSHLNLISVITL